MDLMSGVVAEFARIEGLDENEATAFPSKVGTRAHVLDELLQDAVNSRRDRAVRSRRQSP